MTDLMVNKNRRKRARGFRVSKGLSLVELLIYIVLSGFILLLLIPFVTGSLELRLQAGQLQNLDRTGFLILQRITQKVRFSDKVKVDSPTNELRITKNGEVSRFFVQEGVLYEKVGGFSQVVFVPSTIQVQNFQVVDVSVNKDYPSVQLSFELIEGDYQRGFSTAASRRLQEKK